MATLDNPTHYENAESIAPGRADAFFKWFSPDKYIAETGDVESPFGHVALVQVSRDDIREYVSEMGEPWFTERRNFSPGWYIIRTNSDGLVWGISYGGWCNMHDAFCADTFEELKARQDFNETANAYAQWDAEVNPLHDGEPAAYLCPKCRTADPEPGHPCVEED